jgi:tetratricopeptide (TPR) repeat protein
MAHPSDDEIEQFLAARLPPALRQQVIRHLLAGCGACSRKVAERVPGRLLEEVEEEGRRRKTDPATSRVRAVASALRRDTLWRADDRKLARTLELLDRPSQREDGLALGRAGDLQGPALVDALLEQARARRFHDPVSVRGLTYQAVKAAEGLRPEKHPTPLLLDLQARAWGELANAFKLNEEYGEAEAALTRARGFLRRGSGDLSILAHVALLEASLRSHQRRLIEARELLDRVRRLAPKLGDPHLAAQALLAKGALSEFDDTSSQGVLLLREGLALIDPDREPRLVAIAQHGLINALVGNQEYREAGRLMLRSDLRRHLDDHPRIRWLEGRILGGIGQLGKAESALTQVRHDFLTQGHAFTAANAGLHLIPFLAQSGKYGQAREIAREAYGVLREGGFHREAAKARLYMQ